MLSLEIPFLPLKYYEVKRIFHISIDRVYYLLDIPVLSKRAYPVLERSIILYGKIILSFSVE